MRVLLHFVFLIVACLLCLAAVFNAELVAKATLPQFEPRNHAELIQDHEASCRRLASRFTSCDINDPAVLARWQSFDEREHYRQAGLFDRKSLVNDIATVGFLAFAFLLVVRVLVSGYALLDAHGAFDWLAGMRHRAGTRRQEREFYRIKRLYEDKLVSEEEFEEVRTALRARIARGRNRSKGRG